MSIRTKIAAAAGALALTTLLVPTAAQAQTAGAFTVQPNQDSYNVSCRSGESFGTAPVRLRVTDAGDTTGPWVATWGGEGNITMTEPGRYFNASGDATFPCPSEQSSEGNITITVTAASGEVITFTIQVRRVGSQSGPPNPLVTTVLGLRLVEPGTAGATGAGPAPVGGVRTGAGGTSDPGNNLLLPLGAGLGFAALAAAVMIRRHREPAV